MSATIKTDKRGYRSFWKDGKRLPSPSSVVSRFKDAGGLLYWANQQGLEGITLQEARESAATPGTIVHEMIECDIRDKEFDRDKWVGLIAREGLNANEVWGKVDASIGAFKDWKEMTGLKPVASEISLVSDVHDFGGTMDAALVQKKLVLGDWKTGNLYLDHLIQLGGYVVLWEEKMPDKPLDGAMLLSINKEHGGFTHSHFRRDAMQVAVDQFLALLACYRRDKQLKKMV